jgi:molybdopterin-guanine dinucleotide biosynthesis protein A
MPGSVITVESLSGFSALPVFHLRGAAVHTGPFLAGLLAELKRRGLLALCLEGEPDCHTIASHLRQCDLLFVQEKKTCPGAEQEGGDDPWCLSWPLAQRPSTSVCVDLLLARLDALLAHSPVWGCVLIGGRSSRMGRPKHLLRDASGVTWLERTLAVLSPQLDGVVVSGTGTLPENLLGTPRLLDAPGLAGPVAGLLSAGRWHPLVSWLLVACDMPLVSREAVRWLLAERRVGRWACLPRLNGRKRGEPLLAWYDFRALPLLEEQVWQGNWRIGGLASHPRVIAPDVPVGLERSWENINTPEELQCFQQ